MSDRLYKQQGSRYWYGWYYDANGQRRKVSLKTESKALARTKLRQHEQLASDPSTHQKTERLGDALRHFTSVVLAGRSAGTVDSYSKKAGHLNRVLSPKTRVGELDREVVQAYIATRVEEGAALSTVAKELTVLRQTLKAQGIDPSFVPSVKTGYTPRLRYLTRAEYDLLCANVSERMRTFLHLTCLGGMRAGEAMALRWEHVDFDAELLHVPKGKTVGRTLPLLDADGSATELREFLAGVGSMVRAQAVSAVGVAGSSPAASPILGPYSYHKSLNEHAAKLGLQPLCANDLRRTFCSWLKQAGVDSMIVAELMGHSSTRMIELVYGRLDLASKQRAMGRLPRRPAIRRVK